MLYFVAFEWYDSGTYCTNIVEVDNQIKAKDLIHKHYYRHRIVSIRETNEVEIRPYLERGMPYVRL